MPKQSYWIRSVGGDYAYVQGVDQRDVWTKVRGWTLAAQPGPNDRVYVVHDEAGCGGPLPFEALAEGWADMGWRPGPPPEPIDVTKDPKLVDQPALLPPAVEPEPQTPAAAGGVKDKE